jgi:predicted CXXCH cytochrome family protein
MSRLGATSATLSLASAIAMAFVVSCSGDDGGPGARGPEGEAGKPGPVGTTGPTGPGGLDGDSGAPGPTGPAGDAGPTGPAAPGYVPLAPNGVVGVVQSSSGAALSSGTIYFVPAADVAGLPATTIEAASTNDEPLEDLIAANAATYQKATIAAGGVYTIPTLSAGSYFVTFMPDAADKLHLPGGTWCRKALDASAIVGTQLDLQVSEAPPADAEFVGSGRCVTCHGKIAISKTMHRVGIWSPYESGPLQNINARKEDLYKALTTKFGTSTTVYFSDYDSTKGFDKYRTLETDPGANVSFTVTARVTAGKYEMVLHNVKNPSDPDLVLSVDAIYGGGVHKQRYLTKVEQPGGGFFYATLPLQFQNEGSEAYADRGRKVWRDYHGDWWYDESTTSFKSAIPKNSFEKNCASCHATSTRLTGSDATNWKLENLISDPTWGDFDYDGDGIRDEMNIGCETCHGPGSAHWESAGQGKFIVSPSLLTPERESMICGQCHSRPKGGAGTDSPVDANGWMMRAGTSRAEFLTKNATTQLDGAGSDFYGTTGKHSKSHHQQYSDFIRSGKYKNDTQLLTCMGCHDPHRRDNARQLNDAVDDNTKLCGSCHPTIGADVKVHIDAKLSTGMGSIMQNAKCPDCHMPKVSKTGSGQPGIVIGSTTYWWNDVSSHLFDMPRKADSSLTGPGMPTAYTNPCAGSCHTSIP